ncbi:MAG: 3-oxoacyl-[acyl-carrier protein] reductase, partial [uncultured Rubrobacteraceae bacterium]
GEKQRPFAAGQGGRRHGRWTEPGVGDLARPARRGRGRRRRRGQPRDGRGRRRGAWGHLRPHRRDRPGLRPRDGRDRGRRARPDRRARQQRRGGAQHPLRRGARRGVAQGHEREPRRRVLLLPRGRKGHARARVGRHRQHRLHVRRRLQPPPAPGRLQRLQGRRHHPDQVARRGVGQARCPGQRRLARLHKNAPHRARHVHQRVGRRLALGDPVGAPRRARGDSPSRPLPRLRRKQLRHRNQPHHRRGLHRLV